MSASERVTELADDLRVTPDKWGGLSAADQLVDSLAGLEEALRARDGQDKAAS